MAERAKITIVPPSEEHIAAVREISVAAWQPIFDSYRKMLGDEIFEAQFSNWKQQKADGCERNMREDHAFVALMNGEVVGFICYIDAPDGKTGVISNNAVRPELRGHGIAPQLYEHVLNEMRKVGLTYARVQTGLDEAHAPARRAYEKAGFHCGTPSITYFQKL